MKGSMILTLVTLCVTMLFVADRISTFLHGPDAEPAPSVPEQQDIDWSALWQGFSDLFQGQQAGTDSNSASSDNVVITEDTLHRAWVWTGPDGALRSASVDPQNGMAREVLIPDGMSVQEFFAPSASPRSGKTSDAQPQPAQQPKTDRNRVSAETLARMAAEDRPMSAEERQRFIREGMRLFREHQQRLQEQR